MHHEKKSASCSASALMSHSSSPLLAIDNTVPDLVASLQAELDAPPDRFRDPITLGLINEPMVIGSGHVFDRSTLFDEQGAFRFLYCPMTRQKIPQTAFPLCFLKRELVEWKLHRLDAILSVVSTVSTVGHAPLLDVAQSLLTSLGSLTYQSHAKAYYRARLCIVQGDNERIGLLAEMACWAEAAEEAYAHSSSPTPTTDTSVSELVAGELRELRTRILALWQEGQRSDALTLLTTIRDASRSSAVGAGVGNLGGGAVTGGADAGTQYQPYLLGSELFYVGWLDCLAQLSADALADELILLEKCVSAMRPPPNSSEHACKYWELRLRCAAANRSQEAQVAFQLHEALMQSAKRHPKKARDGAVVPTAIVVSGAGIADVNGRYELDGEFTNNMERDSPDLGTVKYVKGQLWLLRWRMNSGNTFWYVADSTQLERNDGDYYRVRSDSSTPPCDIPWQMAQDGQLPVPSLCAEFSSAPLARPVPDAGKADGHASAPGDGSVTASRGISSPAVASGADQSPLSLLYEATRRRLEAHGIDLSGGVAADEAALTPVAAAPLGDETALVALNASAALLAAAARSRAEPAVDTSAVVLTTAHQGADSGAFSGVSVEGSMVGDVLEVRDTHGIWSTGRLVARVNDLRLGPLLLFHFEGWSLTWLMWLSPIYDAERLRPLTPACPGIGSAGAHTGESFAAVVAHATELMTHVPSEWRTTTGRERTYPFRGTLTHPSSFVLVPDWQQHQPLDNRPFQSCHELARSPELAAQMWAAAVTASPTGAAGGVDSTQTGRARRMSRLASASPSDDGRGVRRNCVLQ